MPDLRSDDNDANGIPENTFELVLFNHIYDIKICICGDWMAKVQLLSPVHQTIAQIMVWTLWDRYTTILFF